MQFFKIPPVEHQDLADKPETAMGLQILGDSFTSSDDLLIVFGGQVAIRWQELRNGRNNMLNKSWFRYGSIEDRTQQFQAWLGGLHLLPQLVANLQVLPITSITFAPNGPLLAAPQPSPLTYGHLPFLGTTGPRERYYRWEPWPTSIRVNQALGTVARGTFAAPRSERLFMQTGFSVVARLALPGLMPACFRWELEPPANTSLYCGAGVPMYGQAGGGVEVEFDNGFTNSVQIPNPVVLPAL